MPWLPPTLNFMKTPSGKIFVIGIGPGDESDITPAALTALSQCDVVIGYHYYFQFITVHLREGVECLDTGMKQEEKRAQHAFELAETGKTVAVISSGDANIYGMAPLVWEMKEKRNSNVSIEVVAGISAFQKAATLLGAPVGHDFCVVSMSDLMTPWEKIEKRIQAAAFGDFITAVYNPKSKGRYWQMARLKELFLKERSPETPVGYVRQAGREEQSIHTTTLGELDVEQLDMFTVVIIGNSQSYFSSEQKIITPRGYYREQADASKSIGQQIMHASFTRIASELKQPDIPVGKKWALLHAIHTTADFCLEDDLYTDDKAVDRLHQACATGQLRTIITDVSMIVSGVRKAALERMGIEIKCYLYDERVAEMAASKGITRTQAGIRLAVKEHPDALYVFGNAPTALMELCTLMRRGKATPAGIIAAPVGFVNVKESKYMAKSFLAVPKIILEGRKGGSNLAATLVNAILSFDDAAKMQPGRDL